MKNFLKDHSRSRTLLLAPLALLLLTATNLHAREVVSPDIREKFIGKVAEKATPELKKIPGLYGRWDPGFQSAHTYIWNNRGETTVAYGSLKDSRPEKYPHYAKKWDERMKTCTWVKEKEHKTYLRRGSIYLTLNYYGTAPRGKLWNDKLETKVDKYNKVYANNRVLLYSMDAQCPKFKKEDLLSPQYAVYKEKEIRMESDDQCKCKVQYLIKYKSHLLRIVGSAGGSQYARTGKTLRTVVKRDVPYSILANVKCPDIGFELSVRAGNLDEHIIDEAFVDKIIHIFKSAACEVAGKTETDHPPPPQPDSAEEEEEDQPPRISVHLELADEPDGMITPADEVTLRLVVKNESQKDILGVKASVDVEEKLRSYKAVTFSRGNGTGPVEIKWNKVIKPGATQPIDESFKVQIADENNEWIQKNLISKSGHVMDGKPFPELNVKEIFVAKISVSTAPNEFKKVMDEKILIRRKGERTIVPLAYPDLESLTGKAPSRSLQEANYHKRGDTHWCHLDSDRIRAVAIRAARYTEKKVVENKSVMDAITAFNPITGDEIIGVTAEYKAFPDDIQSVVTNVVNFVHRSFFPKQAGNPAKLDIDIAEWILSGKIAPENWIQQKKAGRNPFICVSHSYFLGSLLRALGIPVREAFVYEYYYRFFPAQDAASEVWYNKKWNFFALFHQNYPMTDSQEYLKKVPFYRVWVGVSAYTGTGKSRFNMIHKDLENSDCWRYKGVGDKSGFYLDMWGFKDLIIYWIFSPVNAVLTLPDGRKVGAVNSIDLKTYQPFKIGQPISSSGIVNQIKHAYYYPEGVEVYPISEDSSSMEKMKQTFILPAKSIDERNEHTLTLIGTGSGAYNVKGSFIDSEGTVHDLGSYHGEIREGEKVVIQGNDLKPQATPVASMVPLE
jgi:hypothetical protein